MPPASSPANEAICPPECGHPRVGRAIKVLAAQLDEAANLASLVRADLAPQVAFASIHHPGTYGPVSGEELARLPTIEIVLTGSNFRPHAKAVLIAEDREDVPDLFASPANVKVSTPSSVYATFTNPAYQKPVNGSAVPLSGPAASNLPGRPGWYR